MAAVLVLMGDRFGLKRFATRSIVCDIFAILWFFLLWFWGLVDGDEVFEL